MSPIRSSVLALAVALSLAACTPAPRKDVAETAPAHAAAAVAENPFFQPSALPYQAPPFDKIKDDDFQPAIEEGMKRQLVEIRAISASPEAPTFDNTIVAMERSGALLTRVSKVFSALAQANTNPMLQAVQKEEAPRLSEHRDAIFLDAKLFARVKSLYDRRDALGLDAESRRLLERYYRNFVRSGAELSAADQDKLREQNKELSQLGADFREKLLAGTKAGALVVDDAADLAGLSEADLAAASQAA
ncbi:MAG TPA: dipeptidyl carboxypeptidase II, partial [Rudaea sp.]